jgi:tetratricopeptide (TPR) repeat protein
MKRQQLKISCAKLEGIKQGSAYLIHQQWAVTCYHIIKEDFNSNHKIKLIFQNIITENTENRIQLEERWANIAEVDEGKDLALLKLAEPLIGVDPLLLIELESEKMLQPKDDCWAYGFPENHRGTGDTIHGYIEDPSSQDDNLQDSLSLYFERIAAGQGFLSHGFSGAPVFVDDVVIGGLKRVIVQDESEGRRAEGGKVFAYHASDVQKLLARQGINVPTKRVEKNHQENITPIFSYPALSNPYGSFYGRGKELSQLRTYFNEGVSSIVAVEALAGVGKTRLALEFIRLYREDFPGGIFWMSPERETQSKIQLYYILKALEPNVPSLGTLEKQGENISELLRNATLQRKGKKLWVLDNFPEPLSGQAQDSLGDWCPIMGHTCVLITSRIKVDSRLQHISLAPLEEEPASQLLNEGLQENSSPKKLSNQDSKEITIWVGGLPLALEILNRCLVQEVLSPIELLNRCRNPEVTKEVESVVEHLKKEGLGRELRGVSQALQMSFNKLSKKSMELACIIAHWSPEPIPEELLEALGDTFSSSRGELKRRHWITGGFGSFFGSMHRIVASFLRAQNLDPECWLYKFFAKIQKKKTARIQAIEAILSKFKIEETELPQNWDKLNNYLPHALTIVQINSPVTEKKLQIGLNITSFYYYQGRLEEASKIGEKFLELSTKSFGESNPFTLSIKNILALVFRDQGKLEIARIFLEDVLFKTQNLPNKSINHVILIKNNLASILHFQKKYVEARTILNELIALHTKTIEEFIDLLKEGNFELDSRKNPIEQAIDILKKNNINLISNERNVIDVFSGILNLILTVKGNLAVLIQDQGELIEAQEIIEDNLSIQIRFLGEEHPNTLSTKNNLASVLVDQDKYKEAQPLLENICEIEERLFGKHHPKTLVSKSNLALAIKYSEPQKAGKLFFEIFEARKKTLGDEHPQTLFAAHKFGVFLKEQNLDELSEIMLRISYQGRLNIFGKKNNETMMSQYALADLLLNIRNFKEAHTLFQDLLDIKTSLPETEPEEIISIKNKLAYTLFLTDKINESEPLLLEVYHSLKSIYEEDHPDILMVKADLGMIYQGQGRLEEARVMLQESLNGRIAILGEEHYLTIDTKKYLLDVISKINK